MECGKQCVMECGKQCVMECCKQCVMECGKQCVIECGKQCVIECGDLKHVSLSNFREFIRLICVPYLKNVTCVTSLSHFLKNV